MPDQDFPDILEFILQKKIKTLLDFALDCCVSTSLASWDRDDT
jgi:hypothetical protein